jgi:hypothetical protein
MTTGLRGRKGLPLIAEVGICRCGMRSCMAVPTRVLTERLVRLARLDAFVAIAVATSAASTPPPA